ncbi:hypothetical protein MAR621_03125 [Maribacter dokdonensis]|nr:hypothetical protein MAR621_03125 [Maribacter dokdonensis]
MKQLESTAAKILADNPEQNAVYMTADGQAFFNKDARNNHAKERKLEVADFFRNGVATDEETADAIKALEVASQEVEASKAALEQIEKVFTDETPNLEVTPDTNPIVAIAKGAASQLAERKAHDEEMSEALNASANEIEELKASNNTLSLDLDTSVKAKQAAEADLKTAQAELEKIKKELAAAKKTK